MRKVRTAACEVLPFRNLQEHIIPVNTSKLSGIISTDASYVSSETDQADIIVRFGCAVLEIHNGALGKFNQKCCEGVTKC